MVVTEKNIIKKNWYELLISLYNIFTFRQPGESYNLHPLPETWIRLVHGKRVVVFYAGVSFQAQYVASIEERAQQYMGLLCSLGDSIANMKDTVLWWFDDGSLRALLDAVEDEKERNKLERTYMWTIQLHLAKAVHDESGDFARALAWGSVYYGEESDYGREFQKAGKVAATYTLASNDLPLESWLEDSLFEQSIPALAPEWEQCIRDRKVMLFSLQPQTLLAAGAYVVTLLENLVYLAQEHKDICIWWLVDKDLDKVVSLLSENLRLNFEEARGKFKKAQNIIYDESEEVGRALENADVCFGEIRTVKGRHVVRPVVHPPYFSLNKLPDSPEIRTYCRDGQKIYFIYVVRNVTGLLCEADLDTDKAKVLCRLPNIEEPSDWGVDYLLTVKAGQKIIMPPLFSDEAFLEYDLTSGKLTAIPCGKRVWEPNSERYGAFGPITKWGESIFFMGNRNGLLVEYRKADGKYIYHEEWLKKLGFDKKPNFGGSELVDDIWYLVVLDMPVLLAIDMRSLTANVVKLPLPNKFQPRTLSRCDNELWISPLVGNNLACINLDKNKLEFIECPGVSVNQRAPFSSVVPYGKKRLFFPYFASEMYVWQSGSLRAEQAPELTRKLVRPFENEDLRNEVLWVRQGEEDGSFLSFRERGTELIEFWPKSGEVRYHKFRMDYEDSEAIKVLVHTWNLRYILNPLIDEIDKVSRQNDCTIGQMIFETIKTYDDKSLTVK